MISHFFYSKKTPSLNIIQVSNRIFFREWILYKETILTFEGMFYGGMCLKRNFRLQIGKEVLCNDHEARRVLTRKLFAQRFSRGKFGFVSNCIMDGRNISLTICDYMLKKRINYIIKKKKLESFVGFKFNFIN